MTVMSNVFNKQLKKEPGPEIWLKFANSVICRLIMLNNRHSCQMHAKQLIETHSVLLNFGPLTAET